MDVTSSMETRLFQHSCSVTQKLFRCPKADEQSAKPSGAATVDSCVGVLPGVEVAVGVVTVAVGVLIGAGCASVPRSGCRFSTAAAKAAKITTAAAAIAAGARRRRSDCNDSSTDTAGLSLLSRGLPAAATPFIPFRGL